MSVHDVTALIDAVAGLGGLLLAVGSALERLRRMQASQKEQGERIGKLETAMNGFRAREQLRAELGIVERPRQP